MAKCHNAVQGIEYHRRVDDLVIVKLSQVLDFSHPLLVELEIIQLQPESDMFKHVVHNTDDETLVVSIDGADKNSEKVNVAVFDLDWLAEDTFQNINNLGRC